MPKYLSVHWVKEDKQVIQHLNYLLVKLYISGIAHGIHKEIKVQVVLEKMF